MSQSPPTLPVCASMDSVTVETNDGVKLSARIFKPADLRISDYVVVLVHPFTVLGGFQGLLRGIASGLAERGFCAVTFDMRGAGRSSGRPTLTGFTEIGDVVSVCKWVSDTLSPRGIVLVGSSAGSVNSPLDWTEDEWHSNLSTNLTGSWLVSKYVCKLMRDAKVKGCVINMSSMTGLDRVQLPGALGYVASKTGLNAITKVMAMELGVFGIRVNSIAPGLFKSEITIGLMQKDWLERVLKRTIPLKSFGTSDPALTSLVRYLIHDSSEYVTGNIFIVDAGASLPGYPIFSSL